MPGGIPGEISGVILAEIFLKEFLETLEKKSLDSLMDHRVNFQKEYVKD